MPSVGPKRPPGPHRDEDRDGAARRPPRRRPSRAMTSVSRKRTRPSSSPSAGLSPAWLTALGSWRVCCDMLRTGMAEASTQRHATVVRGGGSKVPFLPAADRAIGDDRGHAATHLPHPLVARAEPRDAGTPAAARAGVRARSRERPRADRRRPGAGTRLAVPRPVDAPRRLRSRGPAGGVRAPGQRSRRRSCGSRSMPSARPTTARCSRRSCRCSARPGRFAGERRVPNAWRSSRPRLPSSPSRRAEASSCATSWPAMPGQGRSRRRSGGGSGVCCRSSMSPRRWAGPSRAGR